MRLVSNTGNDRVVDLFRSALDAERNIDVVTQSLSLFALELKRVEADRAAALATL